MVNNKLIQIAVFTTDLNAYNSIVLKQIIECNDVNLKTIHFSKPFNGDKGILKRIERLMSFGIFNLFVIFLQKKISSRKEFVLEKSDFSALEQSDFRLALEDLKTTKVDLVLLLNFNKIIPKSFLNEVPNVFNVHPGKLPNIRGVMPVFWTLINGLEVASVSIHKVESGIDTGDVFKIYSLPIEDRSFDLVMKGLMYVLAHNIVDDLMVMASPDVILNPQNESDAVYFGRPSKNDFSEFFKRNRIY